MSQLPQVGEVFGRYRIDGHIGQGGMGVVLSATDTELDRRVALKVLSAALTGTEEFHHRFQREASVLARLSSPHVIDIYDYGIHQDCPYIATQYVGGGDLGALMAARGAMPPQLAARVCAQVADALGDAHRVSVVHRDVKPSNVLLRDADTLELHAYLCDFGIARADSEGLTVPGSVAGTWSYLSPECGRGETATVASDVYAVGCLFWAAMHGRAPYRGTDVEIAMAHQQQPVPQLEPLDDFAAHANAILARTMAKDPAERFADADQLRGALLAAAQTPTNGIRAAQQAAEATAPPPTAISGGAGRHRTPTPTPTGSHPPAPAGSGYPPPPPAGGSSGSGQPPAPGAPGAAPGYPGVQSTPPRKRRTALIAGAAAAAVLLVIGGVVGVRALTGDDGGGDDGPSGSDPVVEGPIAGDLDGDGLGDLQTVLRPSDGDAVTRDLWTLLSEGDTFATPERTDDPEDTGEDGLRVVRDIGDLDGDDVNELVITTQVLSEDGDEPLYLSTEMSGGATIDALEIDHPVPSVVSANYAADVDGDGTDDIVTVSSLDDGYAVQARLSDGEGALSDLVIDTTIPLDGEEPLDLDGNGTGAWLEVGDYSGDGLADVAVLEIAETTGKNDINDTYESTVSVYVSTGTNLERDSSSQRFASGTLDDVSLVTGDFDGDADDELMVVPGGTGQVLSLEVMDYDDGLQAPEAWGAINPTSQLATFNGIAVSDVDGDGLDDVVSVDPARSTANRSVAFAAISDGERFAQAERWARWQATNTRAAVPLMTGSVYP